MSFMTFFAGSSVALALMALSSMWKGYVFMLLWSWFIVPIFGLPSLKLAPAIAIAIIASFLTHQNDASKEPEGDLLARIVKAAAHAALMPAITLGIGWVVRQFM